MLILRDKWQGSDNTSNENLQMEFEDTAVGFAEFFIDNGTLVGIRAKERTQEEYAATEEKHGMIYKDTSNKLHECTIKYL